VPGVGKSGFVVQARVMNSNCVEIVRAKQTNTSPRRRPLRLARGFAVAAVARRPTCQPEGRYQHVVRLINAGELEARKLPGSSYWQIPLATVLAFEERSERAGERADAFSRSLDALGAPLE
jgi:hypothetical protein